MTTVTPVAPFSCVPADHVARSLLDSLLAELPARAGAVPRPVRVVAELRGSVTGSVVAPERVYASLQTESAGRFDAITLHWSADTGARWCRFPTDPKLPSLRAALADHESADGFEVLRYVPLRRFTFRSDGRVVKIKRRSRLRDSWARALAVETAARRGTNEVQVPPLLAVNDALSAYVQADVPGAALADVAVGAQLAPLLAEAGGVHAAFHRLDATGLPGGTTPEGHLAAAGRDAAWTVAMLPSLTGPVHRALRVLADHLPGPARTTVTCHGDLVPSHLIGGPGGWTVIDHDLAHTGEPERDLALFIAGLAYDVPDLADGTASDPTHASAVAAYLDGYQAAGGQVTERRLAWHLLAAHLHHAWLLATKDRAHPAALAATAARLAAASDRVERIR